MATVLNTISIIFFIVGCVFLVLAVVYFIKHKIHNVINILSGRSARKAIAKMNSNGVRDKGTAKSKKAKKDVVMKKVSSGSSVDSTELLSDDVAVNDDSTEILGDMSTEILDDMSTEILQ